MRKFLILGIILALAGAGYWFWDNNDDFKSMVGNYIENGEFQTLEARFSPQQIMDAHRKELLVDNSRQFSDSSLKYYPYVLMEVKFSHDKKTREGVLLWGLLDGEMVLSTDNWDRTHGFEDTINAKATREEFKVINSLAKSINGYKTQDEVLSDLQLELDVVSPWIESTIDKHLVTRKGNTLQLHLENPKLFVVPLTKFNQMLVSKPYAYNQRIAAKYTISQIEKTVKAAFGVDFSIRKASEVFLPVYGINVQNSDGSITTTYWNAVNGQMINPKYLR